MTPKCHGPYACCGTAQTTMHATLTENRDFIFRLVPHTRVDIDKAGKCDPSGLAAEGYPLESPCRFFTAR